MLFALHPNPEQTMRHALRLGFVGIAMAYMFAIDAHSSPSGAYFWSNLISWALPQMLAPGIASLFKPRIPLISGVALAYGTFAALSDRWGALTLGPIGYYYCTFGACTGVVVAGVRSIRRVESSARIAVSDGFCLVVSGVAINTLLVHLLVL